MAKSFKERYAALKASRAGRGASKGLSLIGGGALKTLGVGVAIGGAGSYVNREFAAKNVAFVRENWYGEGAAMLGEAYLLARVLRRPGMAMAMAGAAGYSLEFNRQLNEYQQGRRKTPPWNTFKSETAGGGSTQALQNDAGDATPDAVSF